MNNPISQPSLIIKKSFNNFFNDEILLYIYLLKNSDVITCKYCYEIPFGINNMYRIKNTSINCCKNCFNKWINNNSINPKKGVPLIIDDIEPSREINDFIEIYINYKCRYMNIKNITININT